MASSLQMNYRDPRFMRMMQQEAAGRPYAALPTRGRATSAFVDQQMQKQGQFDRIGLASQIHEDDMMMRNKYLKFDQKKHKASQKWAYKQLRQDKQNLKGQIGIGLGMGLLSAMEGKRQAQAMAKTNAMAQEIHDSNMAIRDALAKRMGA